MFRKLPLLLAFVFLTLSQACGLFSGSSRDAEITFPKTDVGTPTGPATTKSIGPEGGSIASPDGRITIRIPPNVVAANLQFSIQPITNQAVGGLGSAYRLEPNGMKFAVPVDLSFNYGDADLSDAIPESMAVAFQDTSGSWRSFETAKIDHAAKTLTVATTHFTDFSMWSLRLSPEKATVHIGETKEISLTGCIEKGSWVKRLRTLFGIQHCVFVSPEQPSWSVNVGTLTVITPGAVVYQAPAKKPSPNVAIVRFAYRLPGSPESPDIVDVRTAEITIVDRGFRASGQDGPVSYSGVVCDLEKPFSVTTTMGPVTFSSKFVPDNASSGIASWAATYGGPSGTGSGPYTVAADGSGYKITLHMNSSLTLAEKKSGGRGDVHIVLTPLDGNECGGG
ncbi:MAG: hypothetical protein ABJA02_14330 [Acidobacteriota bacterium]